MLLYNFCKMKLSKPKALKIVVFAILITNSAFAENSFRFDEDTVQFAAIIHRHGDRSPINSYPNDPHNSYKWPGGRGTLSPEGSRQMYTLGKTLRSRYYRLMPFDGFYSAERMQVMSSSRERALMSSQSFLAGFMPPPNDRNPLPISWQPIPIQSIPEKLDNILLQEAYACPKFDQLYLELMNNPVGEFKKFYEENVELFAYLSKHSGMNVTTARLGITLWDVLSIEKYYNLTLPAWTDSIFPDSLRIIAELGLSDFFQTPYMKIVKGGPLVKKIFGQMLEKQFMNTSSRSLYIYSAHDITLLSISRLLNLTNQTSGVPEYGATLAFELHCDKGNDCVQLEVKIVYYFRFSDTKPKELAIPNCPAPCTIDRFAETISDILNFDFANACKSDVDVNTIQLT